MLLTLNQLYDADEINTVRRQETYKRAVQERVRETKMICYNALMW